MDTTTITDNPGDFDVLSLLDGDEYPEETVTLYTDTKTGAALTKLVNESIEDSDTEKEVAALRAKLHESALIVTVKGTEPGKVVDVYNDGESDENHINKLISMAITEVKTGSGAVDTRGWTPERVTALRRKLQVSELEKLIAAVTKVNFDTSVFDGAVDAGFSS